MTTWLDVCRDFAAAHGVEPAFVEALGAFAHPHPRRDPPPRAPDAPFAGAFDDLERHLAADALSLDEVAGDLAQEVDPAQARTFARRLAAVDQLLVHFDDPTGRLLSVGLRQRLRGILAARRPRALRVRALADFYYSYGGRHHHLRQGRAHTSWTEAVRGLTFERVEAGVERACLDGRFAEGPVHANVLRLSPDGAEVVARDCRAAVDAGTTFPDLVAASGAVAAVSGGYFLYSEVDIEPPERRFDPVGLLMEPGNVRSPPIFPRGSVVACADGSWAVERVGCGGMLMRAPGGQRVSMDEVTTRATARHGPDEASVSVAGQTVVAVGRRLRVPVGGFVARWPGGVAVAPGDRVRYSAPRTADGRLVRTGVGGGPMLLVGGEIAIDLRAEGFWADAPPVTFSQDETGDANLLPRLAAGMDDAGRLLLVAVDGRNFERALGMTLRDVALLMRGLGCHRATNLDGGSSKRMVVGGETLDLPSTEIDVGAAGGAVAASVRPVFTGLFVHRS